MEQNDLYELLADIYKEWAEKQKKEGERASLGGFGVVLGQACDPPRKPYVKGYVSMLLARKVPVPAELEPTIKRLARVQDLAAGAPAIQAAFTIASIPTLHELHPGATFSGHDRQCQTPGCGSWFLPWYGQRYCPVCRAARQQHARKR